jgi:hypothetical protein
LAVPVLVQYSLCHLLKLGLIHGSDLVIRNTKWFATSARDEA